MEAHDHDNEYVNWKSFSDMSSTVAIINERTAQMKDDSKSSKNLMYAVIVLLVAAVSAVSALIATT